MKKGKALIIVIIVFGFLFVFLDLFRLNVLLKAMFYPGAYLLGLIYTVLGWDNNSINPLLILALNVIIYYLIVLLGMFVFQKMSEKYRRKHSSSDSDKEPVDIMIWTATVVFNLIILAIIIFALAYKSGTDEKQRLGYMLIEKIELYKSLTGELPESLEELGMKVKDFGPIYYVRDNDTLYHVTYSMSLRESGTWYSDKKRWGE